jgi:hypothetical protein
MNVSAIAAKRSNPRGQRSICFRKHALIVDNAKYRIDSCVKEFMIRVRQPMATEVDANLAPGRGYETGNGDRSALGSKGHKKPMLRQRQMVGR